MMARKKIQLTQALYSEVLVAWLERPSIKYVCEQLELPRSVVQKLSREGIPTLGLEPLPPPLKNDSRTLVSKRKGSVTKTAPSNGTSQDKDMTLAARTVIAQQEAEQHVARIRNKLKELQDEADRIGAETDLKELEQQVDGTMAELQSAKTRADVEEKRIANVEQRAIVSDNTRRSAEETAVARMTLKQCLTANAIYAHLADRMLELIESGNIEMPKVLTPRVVASLAGSLDKLTSATERALKIEHGNAGAPTTIIGVQIGLMLDSCTDEELDYVTKNGTLPPRLRLIEGGGD